MTFSAQTLLDALTGRLKADCVTALTSELRSVSAAAVSSVLRQGNIRITGDGNIVGDNNVSVVVRGEGAAELARVLRDAFESGRALHQLPPPPADFTGRGHELAELRKAVEGGGVAITALQGQGGIGKTALALKLAEEVTPNYPDAQIYVDLRGMSEEPLSPAEAMGHVIRAFNPGKRLPQSEAELS